MILSLDDGTLVNTDIALHNYEPKKNCWLNADDEWCTEHLYESTKHTWYLLSRPPADEPGREPKARRVDKREALRWIFWQGYSVEELTDDLRDYVEEVVE